MNRLVEWDDSISEASVVEGLMAVMAGRGYTSEMVVKVFPGKMEVEVGDHRDVVSVVDGSLVNTHGILLDFLSEEERGTLLHVLNNNHVVVQDLKTS